jgi:putative peptidoglycan lipid II flippase
VKNHQASKVAFKKAAHSQQKQNSPKTPGAVLIAAGIFLSRIFGLLRERVFAHYFGSSLEGDAFKAALRIPNFLQNLLGEGVLSGSFIPVYAKLLAEKHQEEADRVAWAIGSLLFFIVAGFVFLGVFGAEFLIQVLAPGFDPSKKQLTTDLVRIMFPGTGFLVLSAWCLGILNSHRRFFLSYVSPVIWNLSIIGSMIYVSKFHSMNDSAELLSRSSQDIAFLAGTSSRLSILAVGASWGFVLGSVLQMLMQLPLVLRLTGKIILTFSWRTPAVLRVLKNFGPMFLSRGVVQVSSYLDNIFASFLPTGAVSVLSYAQTLYLLPISLFGMSISAAELPAMSSSVGSQQEVYDQIRNRLRESTKRLVFFILPTMVGFIFLGREITALLFQTGSFDQDATNWVWWTLMGSSVGLLATTQGRLYATSFFALSDTKTPFAISTIRVAVGASMGFFLIMVLPKWLSVPAAMGTCVLTVNAGIWGWLEYLSLKWRLEKRIGAIEHDRIYKHKITALAIGCAMLAVGFNFALGLYQKTDLPFATLLNSPWIHSGFVLALFGFLYLGLAWILHWIPVRRR